MPRRRRRVFLLSPARSDGKRAALLSRPAAGFDLAVRLRTAGAPLGEVFSFTSGLYFRGKLAYARAFARPPEGCPAALVIAPGRGLLSADEVVTPADLRAFGRVPVDEDEPRYRAPLEAAVASVLGGLSPRDEVVLLGSIATEKYLGVLAPVLGERLRFPREFVGRGDMSRGALMLRCVAARSELAYVPCASARRSGSRKAPVPAEGAR
jgi:hypothetical protein